MNLWQHKKRSDPERWHTRETRDGTSQEKARGKEKGRATLLEMVLDIFNGGPWRHRFVTGL
jgi:hypothetical protein